MEGTILVDRYQIQELLGSGGSGQTFEGLDLQTQQPVAIKILSLRRATDWKAIELFEREAKTLAQLDHSAIPKYIDFFRAEIDREETFCIVQQLAPGKPLASWLTEGYAFSNREIQQIAEQMLDILIYLQSFAPPIIHRDIKPYNVLRTESGIIYLVDFGAVRDSYHQTITGGSTLVGTYGYMAPEQFRGRAVLATDLYGLGATLINLLTGIDPADLPQKNMRLDFRDRLRTKPIFTNWLERMVEPIPEDRFADARQALQQLTDGNQLLKTARPRQPIARLSSDNNLLRISIPPIWLSSRPSKKNLIVILPLLSIVSFSCWLIMVAALPIELLFLLCLLLIPSIPALFCWIYAYLLGVATRQEITLDKDHLKISNFVGSMKVQEKYLRVEAIGTIDTIDIRKNKFEIFGQGIRISSARFPYSYSANSASKFGNFLDREEQLWLAGEVDERLQSYQAQNGIGNPSKYDPLDW
jgi:eukaryotic-like serine/threonine-protein kinase